MVKDAKISFEEDYDNWQLFDIEDKFVILRNVTYNILTDPVENKSYYVESNIYKIYGSAQLDLKFIKESNLETYKPSYIPDLYRRYIYEFKQEKLEQLLLTGLLKQKTDDCQIVFNVYDYSLKNKLSYHTFSKIISNITQKYAEMLLSDVYINTPKEIIESNQCIGQIVKFKYNLHCLFKRSGLNINIKEFLQEIAKTSNDIETYSNKFSLKNSHILNCTANGLKRNFIKDNENLNKDTYSNGIRRFQDKGKEDEVYYQSIRERITSNSYKNCFKYIILFFKLQYMELSEKYVSETNRICPVCFNMFSRKRKDKKYCSKKCRKDIENKNAKNKSYI